MSIAEMTGDRERGVSLGYVFYSQIAGVLGAFSLAAFAGHYGDIGWRGILLTLIEGWDHYVRPSTAWLLDVTVVAWIQSLFHIHIVLPQLAKDYFSVGFILGLSWIRAARWAHAHFVQTIRAIVRNPADVEEIIAAEEILLEDTPTVGFVRYGLRLITNVVFWPLALVSFVVTPFMAHWRSRLDRIVILQTLLTISPVVYFGLLYAANVWVMH